MGVPNMRNLVNRTGWGAVPATCSTKLKPWQVKGCAVHYTAAQADEMGLHNACADRVRGVQTYHMEHNGWCDIAYNFVVCRHGYIFTGRGWWNRSAAQGTNDGNAGFVAVCFLGDDTKGRDDVTDAGRLAFQRVFARFRVWYLHRPELRPHSDFHPTGCPGDELRAWIKTLT
jgi:hypothetical protein